MVWYLKCLVIIAQKEIKLISNKTVGFCSSIKKLLCLMVFFTESLYSPGWDQQKPVSTS